MSIATRLLPCSLILTLANCGSGDTATTASAHFPSSFQFGTAIAGFQVEMGCPTVAAKSCDDPNSDWYQWITDPTLVGDKSLFIQGDPPSTGPGFYELYAQDLDRAANELKNNALRTSIEWSRVFPTATDGIEGQAALRKVASADALAYYHALFSAMKARGLKPLVTLNHYTLPSWIHDAAGCHADIDHCKNRGWLDHDRVIHEIAKYAGFVAAEFGGDVDQWATLNEPFTAVVVTGYLFQTAQRTNPPGVFLRPVEAKAATTAMIEAHARMYDAVKAADTIDADGDGTAARVGIVYNLQAVSPSNPDDPMDQQGAKNLSYVMNELFLNGVAKGDLDANIDGNVVHRDDLAHRLDFLGIYYYARATVQGTAKSFFPSVSPLLTFNLVGLQLDYEPSGIYEVLKFAQRYGVPMVISETGAEDKSGGSMATPWIARTLQWVERAISEGVDVRGYFYWSLMDNYEWNHGMTVKMGLYGVDPMDKSKARKAKGSVDTYKKIIAAGTVPADLKAMYPIP